ncbi:hypothetical protein F511_44495 [Dorcoceras hygrometricum]|nr:hypothetical protein F511_44495 [Dorcoceras hygrometricum]
MDDGEDEEDMQESVNYVDAYDDVKAEDSCSERSNQPRRKSAGKQAQRRPALCNEQASSKQLKSSKEQNKSNRIQEQYKSR